MKLGKIKVTILSFVFIFVNTLALFSENTIETVPLVNLEELSSQWHKYLKKQYWPDITHREDIKDIAKQITDHEKLNNNYINNLKLVFNAISI